MSASFSIHGMSKIDSLFTDRVVPYVSNLRSVENSLSFSQEFCSDMKCADGGDLQKQAILEAVNLCSSATTNC